MLETVSVNGKITADIYREGVLINSLKQDNLVVDVGLALITSRMEGVVKGPITHMSVGTDVTLPDPLDVDLISMLGTRLVVSTSRLTTTVANDTIQYISTFGAGISTGALTEAGIFNAASGGDMLSRVTFAVINKAAADTMVITWQIVFS